MKDLFIIVPIGIIIGLILIYLKQISNKVIYQKTSQQLSNSKQNLNKIENNKDKNEKPTYDRKSTQEIANQKKQQINQDKSRALSLDQRQNKARINQKDYLESRIIFRIDAQDQKNQQCNQKTEQVPNINESQQLTNGEYQDFGDSFEKQIVDQNAFIPNQSPSRVTNFSIVQQKIFNLYNVSCRVRKSDAKFLGPAIITSYYQDLFIDVKTGQQLNLFLKGYRQVRGDGNCYFTAIAFQYFEILLYKFSNLEFKEFMSQILMMSFQIEYHGYYIEDSLQNKCAQRLVQLLQILRDIVEYYFNLQILYSYHKNDCNPSNLELMMADPNSEFYGLAIIFFRNLAQFLYLQYNSQIITEYKPDLSNELLTWEFQCNDSEMINSSLAKYLNIIINVYLIDQKKSEVTQLNYGRQSRNQIHLIYIPGHYDIGIPI